MSGIEGAEKPKTQEEKANNRFSFWVGMGIGLVIIVLMVIFFGAR